MQRLLCDWPVERPADWVDRVNAPITKKEPDRIEISERRSRPYGDDKWVARTIQRLDLTHTVRREGRPRRGENAGH